MRVVCNRLQKVRIGLGLVDEAFADKCLECL